MGNCYLTDHIAEDYIHIDKTCKIEETQQSTALDWSVIYSLFYLIQISPSASVMVLSNQNNYHPFNRLTENI